MARIARAPRGAERHRALINGTPGAVIALDGQPVSVLAFIVVNGRIVEINGIRDPDRVRRIATAALPGARSPPEPPAANAVT